MILIFYLVLLTLFVNVGNANFVLNLFHTNDMHSRIDETSVTTSSCENCTCYGGFPRLAHFINRSRKNNTLFLNAGDNFQGNAFYTIGKWKTIAAFIDKLGIDVMSLGNHEFDDGPKQLAEYLDAIKTPVVTCNLNVSDNEDFKKVKNLLPWKMFEVNKIKIGVVGYLTPDTEVASTGTVHIQNEIPCLRSNAKKAKEEGAHIVIALGHSGIVKDKEIAAEVEDIDIVVGGHTDTFLYNGNPPSIEKIQGPYPTMITQKSGKQVPVVQAYGYTKYVGNLTVTWNDKFELISAVGNPILLSETFLKDRELQALVDEYKKSIELIVSGSVGTIQVDLNGNCRLEECNTGNLLLHLIKNYFITRNNSLVSTKNRETIGFLQGGSIRTSLSVNDTHGNLLVRDFMTIYPFEGAYDHIQISGSLIIKCLELSITNFPEVRKGGFLQVSGIKVVYDLAQPNNNRVHSVVVTNDKGLNTMLDKNQMYDVIVPQYLHNGGDGYSLLKNIPVIRSYPFTLLEELEKYIKEHGPINMKEDGRIRFIGRPSRASVAESLPLVLLVLFILHHLL